MPSLRNSAEDSCLKYHPNPGVTGTTPVSEDGRVVTSSLSHEKGNLACIPSPITQPAGLENQATDHDEETFPEGGLTAWLVVFGSFCAMVSIYGLINTSAIFESYFKSNQLRDYSHSQIGWIFSLYLFLVFFVGVQAGPIFDHYGPRILVAAGCTLIVISLMLLSLSKTFYQIILTYSVIGGLGGALLNAPAYSAIAHFFYARRGLATGIASTAGGIGGIVFPLLLRHLLGPNGVGFAWSCRILGFIMLGLAVPANLFIKSRLSVSNNHADKSKLVSIWPDFTLFRNRRFAVASMGYFFMEWGLFVPLTYIVSYGIAYGISTDDSSLLLSLLNAGSVVGRFLPGLLADKFGRFNVIIVTITGCTATILCMWLPCGGSRQLIIAFCVLFGVASGSNLSLLPVCLGQFCESQHYGRYFSTATMIASFGTLSSVPIAGALLGIGDRSTSWMALILFAGCSYAAALGCYVAARVMTVGWLPGTKF